MHISTSHIPLSSDSNTYFVDEVCRFDGPAPRDVLSLDLDLLGENVIANLFSGLSNIGSLPI